MYPSESAPLYRLQSLGDADGDRLRPILSELCNEGIECLEISPFFNPVLRSGTVWYFDVLSQAQLQARALQHNGNPDWVPYIHFVSPVADLSVVGRTFNLIVSSHVIEHQVNLVRHLQAVGRLLRPGGIYLLFVPDKRYCFDHFLAPSTIADVLQANLSVSNAHLLKSVVEHRALTTHNDPIRHWAGDHGELTEKNVVQKASRAIEEYMNSRGQYIDVHAWQFTPTSFEHILRVLIAMRAIPFTRARVLPTQKDRIEFHALLAVD